MIERIYDLMAIILLFALNLLWFKPPPSLLADFARIRMVGIGLLFAAVFGIILLVGFRRKSSKVIGAVNSLFDRWRFIPERVSKLVIGTLEQLARALRVLVNLRELAETIGWTLVLWLGVAFANMLVIRAFGLHFGLSEASAKTIRKAHAVQPVTAIQTEYSIMTRDVEHNNVLKTCEELGIGFVPWGPVGMGYLSGKIDTRTKLDPKTDLRSGFDRFSPENIAANMPIVNTLKRFAEKKNATPAQISLAWLLAQKPFIVPIPGTRNIDHLNENLGAINVQLTSADLREIETELSKIKVHGGRMNEEQMKVVDQTV
jgi:hypothetical protein